MARRCLAPYLPLGTPKPVADGVWIVDGPEVRMPYAGLRVPFSTRATIVRLADGSLWAHSPVALDERLAAAIEDLGAPGALIAPNTLHHLWIAAWKARWPGARTYAAPGLQGRRGIDTPAFDEVLGEQPPAAWQADFEQLVVSGPLLSEVVFFHKPSRTLVLTDLIENFEADRVCPRWRWLVRAAGCVDPDGKAPIDMQLSFLFRRRELRSAVRRMLAWAPERVLFAHGRPYLSHGAQELRRAFRWVGAL